MSVDGVGNKTDLSQFKVGLEKSSVDEKDKKALTIFDTIDTNQDGVIDADELSKFKKSVDGNDNNKTSRREIRKFKKSNNLNGEKIKDVRKFLNESGGMTENVAEVENLNGKVSITYSNGSKKIVNSDKSYDTVNVGDDGATTTKSYDANNILQKEITETHEKTEETTYADNGETPIRTIKKAKNNSSTEEIEYKSGEPATKKVVQGAVTSNFEYVGGEARIKSKVENKGQGVITNTTYSYRENGTIESEIISDGVKTTKNEYDETGRNVIKNTINEGIKTISTENKKDGSRSVTVTEGDGSITRTEYNADGKKTSQTKTSATENAAHSVTYDGEGNTTGIVVQNGESIQMIAKKFGVDVDKLIEVNGDKIKGKKGSQYFLVGDEIKIPKELEADAQVLQGRKSADEAKNAYSDTQNNVVTEFNTSIKNAKKNNALNSLYDKIEGSKILSKAQQNDLNKAIANRRIAIIEENTYDYYWQELFEEGKTNNVQDCNKLLNEINDCKILTKNHKDKLKKEIKLVLNNFAQEEMLEMDISIGKRKPPKKDNNPPTEKSVNVKESGIVNITKRTINRDVDGNIESYCIYSDPKNSWYRRTTSYDKEGNVTGWVDFSTVKSEDDPSRVAKKYDANGNVKYYYKIDKENNVIEDSYIYPNE